MAAIGAPDRELERPITTHLTVQRVMAWLGPGMLVIFGVAFIFLARLIPPPGPRTKPAEVVAHIAESPNLFRAGMVVTMLASALLVPFAAAISAQMRRIEGHNGPLSQTQMICGGLLTIEFIIPSMVWLAAAFRIDTANPEIVSTLNDLAFLMIIGVVSTAIVQIAVFGVAILIDKRETPIFPRWAGYLMLWIAATVSPASLCVFFKTGPFAWNGLLALWMPFAIFGMWFAITCWLLLRAIDHQAAEEAGHSPRRQLSRGPGFRDADRLRN